MMLLPVKYHESLQEFHPVLRSGNFLVENRKGRLCLSFNAASSQSFQNIYVLIQVLWKLAP